MKIRDTQADYLEAEVERLGNALTWIENNVPNGIVIVARALVEGNED